MKRNTKIVWACIGGTLGLVMIGQSCSGSSSPASTSTVAATASAPTYLSSLESTDPAITDNVTEANLTALGNATCTDFAEGDTPLQVATEAVNALTSTSPLTAAQLGEIVTEATAYLCPAYGPTWQTFSAAWIAQNG